MLQQHQNQFGLHACPRHEAETAGRLAMFVVGSSQDRGVTRPPRQHGEDVRPAGGPPGCHRACLCVCVRVSVCVCVSVRLCVCMCPWVVSGRGGEGVVGCMLGWVGAPGT